MKITTSAELVDKALKEIKTLSIDEAHLKMTEGKSNIIDIRDIRELQNSGRIEGAVHVPRGMLEFWLDPKSAYFKDYVDVATHELKFILCRRTEICISCQNFKGYGF